MFSFQFLHHQQLQPLTLISSSSTRKSVISYFSIAVLTAICLSSFAHGTVITSHVKAKSCLETRDCRDTNKECVNGKCQCKSYFDYIPEHDQCLKPYGASCIIFEPKEELCNVYKFLACDDSGTCSCHLEGGSLAVYDQYLEMCVAPPGHQCELMAYAGVQKRCVPHAKCVHDPSRLKDSMFYGVCECSKGYLPKGDSCLPELGASCELDGDCGQEEMRCKNRKCECVDDRVYFRSEHACKLKVGEGCEVARGDCVSNAVCEGKRDEMSKWKWRCGCKLGYHEIQSNGTCGKDWHGTCGDNMRVYDEDRGRCSLTVGTDCVDSGPNFCVKHAFCGTGNKCKCFEGYGETENGTCSKVMYEKPKKIVNPAKPFVDPENNISPKPGELRENKPNVTENSTNTSNGSSRNVISGAMISTFLSVFYTISILNYFIVYT